MSFNDTIQAFGAAHDAVRDRGRAAIGNPQPVDLLIIADLAGDAGALLAEPGPWRDAYLVALEANRRLNAACYAIGRLITPPEQRPPLTGPSTTIT